MKKSCQGWWWCFWVYTVNRLKSCYIFFFFLPEFPHNLCAEGFFPQWEMLNIVRYTVKICVPGALWFELYSSEICNVLTKRNVTTGSEMNNQARIQAGVRISDIPWILLSVVIVTLLALQCAFIHAFCTGMDEEILWLIIICVINIRLFVKCPVNRHTSYYLYKSNCCFQIY